MISITFKHLKLLLNEINTPMCMDRLRQDEWQEEYARSGYFVE